MDTRNPRGVTGAFADFIRENRISNRRSRVDRRENWEWATIFKMSKNLVVLSVLGGIVFLVYRYSCQNCQPRKPPTLDMNEWWGPEHLKTVRDESVKPFKVNFTPDMVKDLKERLSKARKWTPPLEGVAFEYGFNSKVLEKVLDYWRNSYKFEEREKFLNSYPHFTTSIQGLNMHFIRVKPDVTKGVEVLPLLLVHGWPGSVREFYEIIPMLTTKRPDRNFVFEVVIPSLPGYGFSEGAVRPGLGAAKISVMMKNLMQRLGHKKFYVQGGDWGSAVVASLATLYPEDILGHHTNFAVVQTSCTLMKTILGSFYPSWVVDDKLADRMYPLSKFFAYIMEEFGYMHLQATKPDTVGVALNDSPSGLAAYILEKFSTWTVSDYKHLPDGGLTKKFTLDQLIDNLMIYWSTSSITTSVRLYAEEMSAKNRALDLGSVPTPVPTWALQAKYELMYQPPGILKEKFTNLLNTTVLEEGGHFIAFEMPGVLADDIFAAVSAFRDWHRNKAKEVKTEL
ncbi:Juvenile hormone epoxide hydrolase [Eumeta japonica]|uniref:microsomal epoxide hydrolase n=1 Tax=Eumeta variegata TaxID=151549 RepID=A0A4C1V225_EUMVA|nr:Juvenile hormone epoxide hydrolase [Eumeta japonica]